MNERLRLAYMTAMRAQHEGGRVELHFGSEVVEYLKAMREYTTIPAHTNRCWGFPVFDTTASPDHISVHVVTNIP